MVPKLFKFIQLNLSSLLLNLLIYSSVLSVVFQNLPPPENPSFAKEQLILNPFRTTLNQALTCGQLIASRGFQFERHFVTTRDGYILQLYRIINPYAIAARGRSLKPILVIHGITTSCSSLMINGVDGYIQEWIDGNPPNDTSRSLAYALANREFDVWFGNDRGTSYSMNHTRLNPYKDPEFWDFSFADMAIYDVPAMVDYIIQETGHEKITSIGFSQGSVILLALLAKHPEFAHKLDLNINIAPIAFIGEPNGILNIIPRARLLLKILSIYRGPALPFLPALSATLSIICTSNILNPICFEIYNYLFGPDRPMVRRDQIKEILSVLDQTSLKNILHVLQSVNFDQIREYDYGPKKNLQFYGSIEPPPFPYENVPTYNLVFISGLNDFLAPPKNVQKLRNILRGSPLVDYVVPWPLWDHTDVTLAEDAFYLSHNVIIEIIRKYGENIEISL